MAGVLVVILCAILYSIYSKNKKEQLVIGQIRGMDIERKKLELVKLQGKFNDYKTNHVLHLLLSLFMLGFWIIPWILISHFNLKKRQAIERLIKEI